MLEPQKVLSEQLAQLNFHISSARQVTSIILACTFDPSVWRDKMVNVSDTLNYVKQVVAGLHCSGYNYQVYMSDFFNYDTQTGPVQHGSPPQKEKSTPSSTQSVPPSEEQATPVEVTTSVFKATHPPVQQSKCNYDCYSVNIDLPVYDTFTHAAQAPPKNTCYCGLKFPGPTELAQHKGQKHKDGYSCSKCGKAQHQYIYTHMCQVEGCKFGKKKGVYGNDDQTLV